MTAKERKLYEAANAYAWDIDTGDLNTNRDIFIAGANWQYEQFEKNRLTACDNMTEEAAEREQRFAVNFIAENNRIPTFSDAIEYGRKTMREKAISRLENLCKEWHLHESTEAKYRMEAYQELLEMLKEG